MERRGGDRGKGRRWREEEEMEGRGGDGGKGRRWREGEEMEGREWGGMERSEEAMK